LYTPLGGLSIHVVSFLSSTISSLFFRITKRRRRRRRSKTRTMMMSKRMRWTPTPTPWRTSANQIPRTS
jgi:hypothetical protein